MDMAWGFMGKEMLDPLTWNWFLEVASFEFRIFHGFNTISYLWLLCSVGCVP